MNERLAKAEALFHEALELPPERRESFLQAACGEDAELLREVTALLRASGIADEWLSDADCAVAGPGASSHPRAPEGLGSVIDRYKLLQQIGEGGCGIVYMAEQEEPVRRRVALKVIKLGMDTKSVVARFEAERQALALMDHPNIARVFDGGATEQGRPFFVMELVRGIKITDYCDRHELPMRERLDLFVQVCHAVQHAHQKGIIHRDLKPSNILVTVNDGRAVPKVIDFGVAKATEQRLTDKTLFTRFETLIGTPAYMSPEQAEMSSLDIDTRSDIYSLGVLLYELLTGRTPFDQRELLESGIDEMRRTIREKEPTRPSTRLRTLAPNELSTVAKCRRMEAPRLISALRGDLDWIVMKCLDKDRTRRYETANGLAMDIQRCLNHEAVVARPPTAAYRLQKAIGRNKGAFVATGVALLMLTAGATISMWQAIRARQAEAEQSRLRVREAELRAHAEAQAAAARRRAYASDLNLLQRALELHSSPHARTLLDEYRPRPGETDLRGWEWRYLWKLLQSDASRTVQLDKGGTYGIHVSHDGKWLARCLGNGLKLYQLPDAAMTKHHFAEYDDTLCVFSPTQPLIAFVGINTNDQSYVLMLWNYELGLITRSMRLPGRCQGIAFSADGERLVSLAATGMPNTFNEKPAEFVTWRVKDGEKLRAWPTPVPISHGANRRHAFAISADARYAAFRSRDDTVSVFDLETGTERWSVQATKDSVAAIAMSPNARFVASSEGYTDGTIKLWDGSSGRELAQLKGHSKWVSTLLFLPDGDKLVSYADGTVRVWDVNTHQEITRLRGDGGRMALSADQKTVLTLSGSGQLSYWEIDKTPRQAGPVILPEPVLNWTFTPDSKSLITVHRNGAISQWSGERFLKKTPIMTIGSFDQWPTLSLDGRFVASGYSNGLVRVWDLTTGQLAQEFRAHDTKARAGQFSGDGRYLTTAGRVDQTTKLWDLRHHRELAKWRSGHFGDWSFISPDGRWVIALDKGSVRKHDVASGNETLIRIDSVTGLSQAGFSPDGRWFSIAGEPPAARLFNANTFVQVSSITQRDTPHSVGFSPDGKRVAIGSVAKEAVKIWDWESKHDLLTLEGPGSLLNPTRFSPDGNTIAGRNSRGDLLIWQAPSWEEIAAAERTQTERY